MVVVVGGGFDVAVLSYVGAEVAWVFAAMVVAGVDIAEVFIF